MKQALMGVLLLVSLPLAAAGMGEAQGLYLQHCAVCHGADRFGLTGPALLPESLARLRRAAVIDTISAGRAATQMQGFAGQLTPTQIAAIADYLAMPPAELPRWELAQMKASHTVFAGATDLPDKPRFTADPLNLFVVVESGDNHITVLDGDRFEPIHRFPTHFALHGGPKYAADGRFVYLASRDGWISKYDLYNLTYVAEIRVGLNTRNLAVSADGRYVLVGNTLPGTLVVLDGYDLTPLKVMAVADEAGQGSRVAAVYTAPPRGSFIAIMKDIPEIWELPYTTEAVAWPIDSGSLHDYRAESGEAFPVRRIRLERHVDDFVLDPAYEHLIGAARDGTVQVVNLTAGRRIANLPLTGMPHLASGITWMRGDRRVLATPNLKEGAVTVIDTQDWKAITRVPTLGPGFFMRSHENSRYAWVDSSLGPARDTVQVIDKETLEVAKTIQPAPGKTASHVEFTRDGRYALLSIWEMDGAVVVYDAQTLREVKRVPMVKPSGKYNVWNKTRLSEGTSH
ncbi:MAG: nitrite reductase [Gammaproteobacteria bacterium]|nr:nitrite reductase [Gammaproteobacteria bacterium]